MGPDPTALAEPWPPYGGGLADYTHAIGVLSVNFNDLENKLLDLLKIYAGGAPDDVVAFVFEKFNSKELKLQFLEFLLKRKKPFDVNLLGAINAFYEAYGICANNRNIIVHSRVHALRTDTETFITSKRARKHGRENHRDMDLTMIRQVADDIHAWNRFASHLIYYVLRKRRSRQKKFRSPGVQLVGPTTLPQKPSEPVDLEAMFLSTQNKRRSPHRPSPL